MYQVVGMYSGWSATLYFWARTAVGVLLAFWVLSGAAFGLRFLAFFLLDKDHGHSPLTTASRLIPFPMDHLDENSHRDPSHE
jgi:hypothetical protein